VYPEKALNQTLFSRILEFPDYEYFPNVSADVYTRSKKLFLRSGSTLKGYAEITTLQLASIITTFDIFCMKNLKSSPLHDPTLSSYANNVCFSMSNEQNQFVKSEEIINLIESGIRGGI